MKKVKLTQEENELLKKTNDLHRKLSIMNLEASKFMSDFWLMFQQRTGGGSYVYNQQECAIYEKDFAETLADMNNKK